MLVYSVYIVVNYENFLNKLCREDMPSIYNDVVLSHREFKEICLKKVIKPYIFVAEVGCDYVAHHVFQRNWHNLIRFKNGDRYKNKIMYLDKTDHIVINYCNVEINYTINKFYERYKGLNRLSILQACPELKEHVKHLVESIGRCFPNQVSAGDFLLGTIEDRENRLLCSVALNLPLQLMLSYVDVYTESQNIIQNYNFSEMSKGVTEWHDTVLRELGAFHELSECHIAHSELIFDKYNIFNPPAMEITLIGKSVLRYIDNFLNTNESDIFYKSLTYTENRGIIAVIYVRMCVNKYRKLCEHNGSLVGNMANFFNLGGN